MNTWHCDACGQRIRHAREGWISLCCDERGHAVPTLVHHTAASPWAAWSGCAADHELASLHLLEALRDEGALEQLATLGLLDAEQLQRLRTRLRGDQSVSTRSGPTAEWT